MDSREVTVAGLWTFAIVTLVGGLYGRLDGFFLLIVFIVAVVVSAGIALMPDPGKTGSSPVERN